MWTIAVLDFHIPRYRPRVCLTHQHMPSTGLGLGIPQPVGGFPSRQVFIDGYSRVFPFLYHHEITMKSPWSDHWGGRNDPGRRGSSAKLAQWKCPLRWLGNPPNSWRLSLEKHRKIYGNMWEITEVNGGLLGNSSNGGFSTAMFDWRTLRRLSPVYDGPTCRPWKVLRVLREIAVEPLIGRWSNKTCQEVGF
jgi:hypothetical protein